MGCRLHSPVPVAAETVSDAVGHAGTNGAGNAPFHTFVEIASAADITGSEADGGTISHSGSASADEHTARCRRTSHHRHANDRTGSQ